MRYIILAILLVFGSNFTAVASDFNKGLAAYNEGDYESALRMWTPIAEQGNAGAQSNLGFLFENGHGVVQDYQTAKKWYTLAAQQKHAYSQYSLGVMYANGKGIDRNNTHAYMWAILAQQNKNKDASNLLEYLEDQLTPAEIVVAQELATKCMRKKYVDCLESDDDFKKGVAAYDNGDFETALKIWTHLANLGDADAQTNVGKMYENGEVFKQNFIKAKVWYERAAAQDHPIAIYNIGLMYRFGRGLEVDLDKAFSLVQRSARLGDTIATYNLGTYYYEGIGTKTNHKKAVGWFLQAAKNGYAKAFDNLGSHYAMGQGVSENDAQAYMWFNLVEQSELRHSIPKWDANLELANKLMSADSKKKGLILLEKCLETEYRVCFSKKTWDELISIGNVFFDLEDYEFARLFWIPVADLGDPRAAFNLSLIYLDGLGVEKNIVKAEDYLTAAARGGLPMAQFNLGRLIANEALDEKDKNKWQLSLMWWLVAESLGLEEGSKYKHIIEAELSSIEIKFAKNAAKKCLDSNYNSCVIKQ